MTSFNNKGLTKKQETIFLKMEKNDDVVIQIHAIEQDQSATTSTLTVSDSGGYIWDEGLLKCQRQRLAKTIFYFT